MDPAQAGSVSRGACVGVNSMGRECTQVFMTARVYNSVYGAWLQVCLPCSPSLARPSRPLSPGDAYVSPETQCGCHLFPQAALAPLAGSVATLALPGAVFRWSEGVSFTSVSLRCLEQV